MRHALWIPAALTALCLAATPAAAQLQTDREAVLSVADDEWISLNGTVSSVTEEGFVLDYGRGEIRIEMENSGWDGDAALRRGDRVMVTGSMDADLYERRTIEASSVYAYRLQTRFYADPSDEESPGYSFPPIGEADDDEWVAITGTVVAREDGALLVDTGPRTIKVDTTRVDHELEVKAGDRVTAYGEMDEIELLERRELLASSVIRLS